MWTLSDIFTLSCLQLHLLLTPSNTQNASSVKYHENTLTKLILATFSDKYSYGIFVVM